MAELAIGHCGTATVDLVAELAELVHQRHSSFSWCGSGWRSRNCFLEGDSAFDSRVTATLLFGLSSGGVKQ